MFFRINRLFIATAVGVVSLSGCSTLESSYTKVDTPEVSQFAQTWQPEQWQTTAQPLRNWSNYFNSEQLNRLVKQAVNNNPSLKQQQLAVAIKQQQLSISEADLWPDIALSMQHNRRGLSDDQITQSANMSLDINYELDWFGKFSAKQQQAQLTLLAEKAKLEQQRQSLIAQVVNQWANIYQAQQLLKLYQQREQNTQANKDIIFARYQKGLSEAKDVYLANSEWQSQRVKISQQQQSLREARRALLQLLGQAPDQQVETFDAGKVTLPSIQINTAATTIERNPQIKQAWYQMAAQNAELAFRHKQRFPSFRISLGLTNEQQDFHQLFSAADLAWSMLGSITMPIFQGGQLKANERIAALTLAQLQQNYRATVYQVFTDIENALTQSQALTQQIAYQQQAVTNADNAYHISFEQYQQGLVEFTSVLDAQNRWYDAQASLINLTYQQLINRVTLQQAFGANFFDDKA